MALPLLAPILIGVVIAAVFRILLAVGLGFLTFTVALPQIYDFIRSYFTMLPPEVLGIVGILRMDIAITILISAAASKVIYKISAAPLVSLGS